jgi:hypothetical protein
MVVQESPRLTLLRSPVMVMNGEGICRDFPYHKATELQSRVVAKIKLPF